MSSPGYLMFSFFFAVAFIVFGTAKLKWHPFIVLLLASYALGFASGLNLLEIGETIRNGFGGILGYIGIVILLGTLIGTILERTGITVVAFMSWLLL